MAKNAREHHKREDSHLVQPSKDNQQGHNLKPTNPTSEPARVLQLQRTHGNQFVQRLVESGAIQREYIEGDLSIGGNLNVGGAITEGKGNPPPPPAIKDEPSW